MRNFHSGREGRIEVGWRTLKIKMCNIWFQVIDFAMKQDKRWPWQHLILIIFRILTRYVESSDNETLIYWKYKPQKLWPQIIRELKDGGILLSDIWEINISYKSGLYFGHQLLLQEWVASLQNESRAGYHSCFFII